VESAREVLSDFQRTRPTTP